MDYFKLWMIGLLVGAMLLQSVTTFFHSKAINEQFMKIKKRYPIVSVGKSSKMGIKRMAVVAVDDNGILQEIHILAGFTIFARLKPVVDYVGDHYTDVRGHLCNGKNDASIMNAISYIEEQEANIWKH